ncbi:hypothetical protein BsWGS_28865 [Bradybaena similaris]
MIGNLGTGTERGSTWSRPDLGHRPLAAAADLLDPRPRRDKARAVPGPRTSSVRGGLSTRRCRTWAFSGSPGR